MRVNTCCAENMVEWGKFVSAHGRENVRGIDMTCTECGLRWSYDKMENIDAWVWYE